MSRSSIKNLPRDANQRAFAIVQMSTEEQADPLPETPEQPTEDTRSEISKYLSAIGKKGGLKGGVERAKSLSAKRRKEIAKKAAETRWASKNPVN